MTRVAVGDSPEDPGDRDWVREAVRLHRRYVLEIVEGFGLCPWAARARADDRLRVEVSLQTDGVSVDRSLAALDRWADDDAMEVGFLLYPRVPLSRADFDRFVAVVRDADAKRYELGAAPFAMVGFHPEAEPHLDDAERLVPFLRRTPDPCVQVIRTASLDRVRGSVPEGTQFVDLSTIEAASIDPHAVPEVSVRERVARANLATARRVGVHEMSRRMDAIRDDRDATYRALRGAP